MKIVFFPASCITFDAFTLDQRPLGGTETAVIRLANSLEKAGVEVVVVSQNANPQLSSPLYVSPQAVSYLENVDIVIAVRNWQALFSGITTKKRALWTGDSYDQVAGYGIGDPRCADLIDRLFCVSNWHKNSLCEASGFPNEKARVLRNGVHLPYFEDQNITKIKKRLIYSSTPYRGLKHVPQIYEKLLESHTDAELVVCSGYDVYKGAGAYPEEAIQEYEDIKARLEKLPNCRFIGNIKQDDLAREFLAASVLCYPNTFEETSCISVIEAKAAGCIPVTTPLAALPETVGDGGILIPGDPESKQYQLEMISKIDELWSKPKYLESMRIKAKEEAALQSWDKIAEDFIEYATEIITP